MLKIIPSLLFALLLFACGERPSATTETMDSVETDEMETTMPDRQNPVDATAGSETLQATISAVQSAGGDVTALAPATAVSNIDTWISQLSSMDGTDDIVNGLQDLKTELTSESIDGGAVSELLFDLADETRDLGGNNMGLSTLASALEAGAEKLAGK